MNLAEYDKEMGQDVEAVGRIHETLQSLQNCPLELALNLGPGKERQFFWCALAVQRLHEDPFISLGDVESCKTGIQQLAEAFVSHYPPGSVLALGDMWFISAMQTAGILRDLSSALHGMHARLPSLLEDYFEADMIAEVDKRFRRLHGADVKFVCGSNTKRLRESIERPSQDTREGTFQNQYLANLFFDFYRLPSLIGPTPREPWNYFGRLAIARLALQIDLHEFGLPTADPLSLAISARMAWIFRESNGTGNQQGQDTLLCEQIRRGASICCEKAGTTDGRVIQKLPSIGALINMPFEEIFMLGELEHRMLPQDLSLAGRATTYFENRIATEGDKVKGLVHVHSLDFPDRAPYFTAYGVVLLSDLARLLRDRIRERISLRLSVDSDSKPGGSSIGALSSNSFLDSQEQTGAFVARRLEECWDPALRRFTRECNTLLLFGPPGTGKTSFQEALRKELSEKCRTLRMERWGREWELIPVDPGVFLTTDSHSSIFHRVSDLFRIMSVTEGCVFFFDEAEELMPKREKQHDSISRLFTSAMLPQLSRLGAVPSFFVFATNFVDAMDSAATRKGRFAIRKGIGGIHDDHVAAYIDKEFAPYPEEHRDHLKAWFGPLGVTVKELRDTVGHPHPDGQ